MLKRSSIDIRCLVDRPNICCVVYISLKVVLHPFIFPPPAATSTATDADSHHAVAASRATCRCHSAKFTRQSPGGGAYLIDASFATRRCWLITRRKPRSLRHSAARCRCDVETPLCSASPRPMWVSRPTGGLKACV